MALPKGETPRVSGEIAPCSADVPCSPYLEKNGKNVEPLNDDPGGHTPPPPARYRGLSAARPPPLRCAHGSGPPRPTRESRSHGRPARSGCVLLRGSGQPAPPSCRSRLRSAGCAVCPPRRSRTQAALSVPRGAAHTQPPLWAGPDGSRPLRRAGRALAAARTPLRRTGRCDVAILNWTVG